MSAARGIVPSEAIVRSGSDPPVTDASLSHAEASSTDALTAATSAGEPAPEVGASSARIVALIVGVVMLALLGLMIWGIGRAAQGTVGEVRLSARPAPSFTIPLLNGAMDGKLFDMAATRGKPVLINFWASWCIPCEDEAGTLERASRQYGDRVTFIGVNVQDTDANARDFLRRFGVTYPNGTDLSGAVAVDYGMSGVPETYFVDRNGQLTRKWQGPLDDARLKSYLDELLR
jgi:cytochrome c biogenesis protein CcmG/thiol:disulfide interchange protein DsbE